MEKANIYRDEVGVTLVGGPTALLEIGGLRLLTDPTFDEPGEYPRLTKIAGPALTPDQLGIVDVVLLSHDQHDDNLDIAGRAFLTQAPLVLTTSGGAARLGGAARALAPWQSVDIGGLRVTGTPAQHGPDGEDRGPDGEVTGFVVSGDTVPTLYVSGDNASVRTVVGIVDRLGPVDIAVLFAGGARVPGVAGGRPLTLTSQDAVEAAKILQARHVVPVHIAGWQHFREGPESVQAAFDAAGLAERLHLLAPGERITI